jgi:AAA15 family ATPase/GTPase
MGSNPSVPFTLTLYSLFQSDRKNSDSDSEVQDPLKEAVKQILTNADLVQKLNEVSSEVVDKLREVSHRTLEKLREMNPELANTLSPVIPTSDSLKWADVFKSVSITSDEDIPINKRGSGVKRLVLLNFFRAEAERRRDERNCASIIYAIEEPETSQHTAHQRMLIKALIELSLVDNTQVIMTTHSANLVKALAFSNLRLIAKRAGQISISSISPGQLPYPSLNEVNYLAFAEVTEEYHNELYGYLDAEGHMDNYKANRDLIPYNKVMRNGTISTSSIPLTEYIRHQIHHPENTNNPRYTAEQLRDSIIMMRDFIYSLPR